jgi:hypothetical protein
LEEVGPQIDFIKQDIAFADPIDTVTWNKDKAVTLPAIGVRSRVTPAAGAEALATFSDGSAAVVQRSVGKGKTIYCGFLPALSYYKPAIPKRPVDRTSAEDSLAHLVPTKFDENAYQLIGLPAEGIARPVQCSEPRVETSVIESPEGLVIVLVNWSGQPVKQLSVSPAFQVPDDKISLASGGMVGKISDEKGMISLTLDLDVADAIILRK